MGGWQIGLLVVTAWIAITALVRLMIARRNRLWTELEQQASAERRKKQDEER